jgi:hypothetical protein
LSRLDHAALVKQALFDDAADLRAHFGHEERAGSTRQFARQRNRLRMQCDHRDLRLAGGRCLGFAAATRHEQAGKYDGAGGETEREIRH